MYKTGTQDRVVGPQHPSLSHSPHTNHPLAIMNKLQQIPTAFPRLYDVSDSIKVVEVAKKYEGPEVNAVCCYPLVILVQH